MNNENITINLEKEALEEKEYAQFTGFDDVNPYSKTWAGITRPFAWVVFSLIAIVIIFPFIFVCFHCNGDCKELWDRLFDWAKTVLAPVVGFGSAVIGYYFGTRNSSSKSIDDE